MQQTDMSNWTKKEGDTIYITAGPYKHETATVMRLTAKKMEVYLHADKHNGHATMINQGSGYTANENNAIWNPDSGFSLTKNQQSGSMKKLAI